MNPFHVFQESQPNDHLESSHYDASNRQADQEDGMEIDKVDAATVIEVNMNEEDVDVVNVDDVEQNVIVPTHSQLLL